MLPCFGTGESRRPQSAAALVVIAGGTFAAITQHRHNHEAIASVSNNRPIAHTKPAPPPGPLRVVSVSPGESRDVNGGAPIKVTFSSALAPASPLPSLSPKIAGSWQVSGGTATFTPSVGYLPGTTVTLKIPGGQSGIAGAATSAGTLRRPRPSASRQALTPRCGCSSC